MDPMFVAAVVFVITYVLIVFERLHRTLAALSGGLLMILLGIITQEEAFQAVDWNVIFLLVGMMVIAGVISDTGLFQWFAVQSVKHGRGRPIVILIFLVLVTAVASALLDNVTIVILIAPVCLFIAARLHVSTVPFLIAVILASNIGGTATLIGDPPNMLIGSAANLSFTAFAVNLAPISIAILVAFVALTPWLFGRSFRGAEDHTLDLSTLDTSELITDAPLLRKSTVILGAVLVGFLLHDTLDLSPATVALTGATALMIWTREDPGHRWREVDWSTLLFFVGLFIAVEALVAVGIVEQIAERVLHLTQGQLTLTTMLLLWFSALGSGVVDNVPYTAAVIPIVQELGREMPVEPLWWALALGACLGGNATLVGASANIVVASLAARGGHPISFTHFLRYGVLITLLSLVMASVYIWLRYL